MKTLITKSDGTPTKSKVRALQYLESKGISKDCLIEENGQFYFDDPDVFAEKVERTEVMDISSAEKLFNDVSWETPVFDKNNEKTKLIIPGTDVSATINGKHPAGQMRSKSAFEICIGDENFVMSVDLISRIFKVWG